MQKVAQLIISCLLQEWSGVLLKGCLSCTDFLHCHIYVLTMVSTASAHAEDVNKTAHVMHFAAHCA